MNGDCDNFKILLQPATFLIHSRGDLANQKIRDQAIRTNLFRTLPMGHPVLCSGATDNKIIHPSMHTGCIHLCVHGNH